MTVKPLTFRMIVRNADATRGHLQSDCEKGCAWPCSTSRPLVEGAHWRWDGNAEAPTLTPSIDCRACGRHFSVTAGRAQ